jgi:hypothetical protein
MAMDRTAEAAVAGAPGVAPADQLVALRGELWQRHVLLQSMDQGDDRYEDATAELLHLTGELLRVESDVGEIKRAARRRAGRIGFAVAGVLLLGAIGLALASPVLGLPVSRVAAGSVLLIAVVVFAATLVVRRRNSVGRIANGRGRDVPPAGSFTAVAPDSATGPVLQPARD